VTEVKREKRSTSEKIERLRVDTSQAGKREKNYRLKGKDPMIGFAKGGETRKTTYLSKNPKFTRL
jgi:hypothetical protein